MEVDRQLQNEVLQYLKACHRASAALSEIYANVFLGESLILSQNVEEYIAQTNALKNRIEREKLEHLHNNLVYLEGHKLVELDDEDQWKITANGIDFIQNDGGLSAILNVQTIRFHEDTRQLLIDVINRSALNPSEKQKMFSRLQQLPADAIRQLLISLLDKGIDLVPSLLGG